MRFLFKKRDANAEPKTKGLKSLMEPVYKKAQHFWVNRMERITIGVSNTRLKAALFLFVIVFGGISVFVTLRAFYKTETKANPIAATGKLSIQESKALQKRRASLTQEEYNSLYRYKIMMDSLAASPEGKPLYEKIVRGHPGLMDTLAYIEKYYEMDYKNEKRWKKK